MTNLYRKNETKSRKKKISSFDFKVYKIPLLQLACTASYAPVICSARQKDYPAAKGAVQGYLGIANQRNQDLICESLHNGFIFSTETYAKAQFNLGLLPFSLGLVEALISFRFEESEKEIKHKMKGESQQHKHTLCSLVL